MIHQEYLEWSRRSDILLRKGAIIAGVVFLFVGCLATVSIGGYVAGLWDISKAGNVYFGGLAALAIVGSIGAGILLLCGKSRDLF